MKNKNKTTKSQKPQDEASRHPVSCLTCMYGLLHRYDDNPVLATCLKQPVISGDPRFQYQIEVATALRKCVMYKRSMAVKTVEQRTKQ